MSGSYLSLSRTDGGIEWWTCESPGGQVATFDDLVNFVDTCSEAMNDPIYSKAALSQQSDPKEEKKRQDGYKRSSFSTNIEGVVSTTNPDGAGSTGIKQSCPSCNQQHDLEHCRMFLKKSIEEKKSFLKEKKLCFGCYGSHHMVKGCLNKKKCKTCGKRHPTALHIPGFKLPGKLTTQPPRVKVVRKSTMEALEFNLANRQYFILSFLLESDIKTATKLLIRMLFTTTEAMDAF